MTRTASLAAGIALAAAGAALVVLLRARPALRPDGLCFVRTHQVHCLDRGLEAQLTVGPRAHFPAGTLDGRLLVVESAGEGDDHVERLLLVAFDGGVRELHGEARRARAPVAGPGFVLLESSRSGFSDLVRLWSDGGVEQLTSDGEAGSFEPSLLPDGGAVYVSSRDGDPELYELPARRLTRHPAEDVSPRVSPRGDLVVFVSSRAGTDRLYLLPLGGGEPWPLHPSALEPGPNAPAPREALERDPVWTPDGREVVFAARTGAGRLRLWAVDVARGTPRALTDGTHDDDQPALSPDGRWLAFARGEPPELYLMPLEGGPATRLTHGWLPRWR